MPRERPSPRAVLGSVALVLAVLAAPIVAPVLSAGAAGTRRAGVIVDTGSEVHRVVITFSEDSISGIDALQRAGANPAIVGYSGVGGAVCALYGVGNPATLSSCLGGTDPRFWGYWHVPAGQAGFTDATFSGAGAGSVRVRDGDVEGWRYGTGRNQPPPFATIDQISPPPPPPPPPSPPAALGPSAATGAAAPAGAAGVQAGRGATTTTTLVPGAPGAPSAAAGAAPGSSTTSTTRDRPDAEVAAERASASRAADGEDSSRVLPVVGFVAVLAVLGAGIFFARRARIGRSTGAP